MSWVDDLFGGSSHKTTVATSVMRAIPDNLIPDSALMGMAKAVIESGDSTDYVLEELVNSMGVRVEGMYNYAAQYYTHGLPSGQTLAVTQSRPLVETVLVALEDAPVTVEYSHYGAPNSLHIGWMQIILQYGYNPATNQLAVLTALKGQPVYLDDMVVVVPQASLGLERPGVLTQWGTSTRSGVTPERLSYSALRAQSPVSVDPLASEDYIRVDYVWGPLGALQRGSEIILLSDELAQPGAGYYHAKYRVGNTTKYWMYAAGQGSHPGLDQVFNPDHSLSGSYFPFIYFRYNKASQINNTSTAAYRTSKKLTKFLGINYDTVGASIDANPGIADVQQAMLLMAIPATTTNALEQRYLFDFFDNLYYADGQQRLIKDAVDIARLLDPESGMSMAFGGAEVGFSIVLQDKRFKMALGHNGVYRRYGVGSPTSVGSYTSGIASELVHQTYTEIVPATEDTAATTIERVSEFTVQYHYYRHQVSQHVYDEILVVGLQLRYYIIDGYSVLSYGGDNRLLIPLDRAITHRYSVTDREQLYSRSLHYVFNSVHVQEIKWYESAIFRDILMIAAVVITIMTWGEDGGALISAVAALNATAIYLALYAIAIKVLIGIAIAAAFKIFVRTVGKELAFLTAIMAVVIAVYYKRTELLQQGCLRGTPWSTILLQVSTGLSQGISANVRDEMDGLAAEYQEFNLYKDTASKELATANKLLESHSKFDPLIVFCETPNDFYNRTIHCGNVGMLSIGAISSYTDIALRLPTMNDTLEEMNYAA